MRAKKTKTFQAICKGGPWNGHTVLLTSGGTLPLVVRVGLITYTGRYDGSMNWIPQSTQ